MNGGWPYLTRGRAILLILALVGLAYLLLGNRPEAPVISGWSGNQFLASVSSATGAGGSEVQSLTGRGLPGAENGVPTGNPLRSANTVLTQGYGVGSHAPAAIWGGIDLALDGNGDGQADINSTMNAPIYATHGGVASVRPGTWPAGNYLAVVNDRYKTAYAHLNSYAVNDGDRVARGQLVGYVGSTGQATGPHLHYEVWENGINVNPLNFGALEGVRQ